MSFNFIRYLIIRYIVHTYDNKYIIDKYTINILVARYFYYSQIQLSVKIYLTERKKLGFIILLAFLKLKTHDIMLISSSIRELCRVSPPMPSFCTFFSSTFKKKFQKFIEDLEIVHELC